MLSHSGYFGGYRFGGKFAIRIEACSLLTPSNVPGTFITSLELNPTLLQGKATTRKLFSSYQLNINLYVTQSQQQQIDY